LGSVVIPSASDRPTGIALGADTGYDAADFVNELRAMNVRPHVAQNINGWRTAIDRRTTRHAGYALSQRIRKPIEDAFGWIEDRRRPASNEVPRDRSRRVVLHLCRRRIQFHPVAEAATGQSRVKTPIGANAKTL